MRLVLLIASVILARPSFGTVFVTFANFGVVSDGSGGVKPWSALIRDSEGIPVDSTAVEVELLYHASPYPGAPFVSLPPTAKIGAFGLFAGGLREIPETLDSGTQVTLLVRAWDSLTGNSYDAAAIKGQSNPFTFVVPEGPVAIVGLQGMNSFAIVPEPAETALAAAAVLCGGAIWLRRRSQRSANS